MLLTLSALSALPQPEGPQPGYRLPTPRPVCFVSNHRHLAPNNRLWRRKPPLMRRRRRQLRQQMLLALPALPMPQPEGSQPGRPLSPRPRWVIASDHPSHSLGNTNS